MALTLNYERAGDISADKLTYGILLLGKPGTGKSWGASTAPKPLIVVTEKNGIQSIRHANPDAIIIDVHDQTAEDDDGKEYKVRPITVVRTVMKAAIKGTLHELVGQPIETLVFDSLTDTQRLFRDEIAGQDGNMSKRDWGTLADRFRLFLRALRDCPYNYIGIALVNSELEEATGIRHLVPAFQGGSTRNEIGQWFNIIAHMYKKTTTDGDGLETTIHRAMLDGPSNYMTKSQHPLRGTLDPDLTDWIRQLSVAPKPKAEAAK
jgi:hypothetical protein